MKLLKGSLALKFMALVLAVLTYAYIRHEIKLTEDADKQTDPSYKLIKLTAKKLPVKVRVATAPPEGYRIVDADVKSTPAEIVVVGPQALLEEANNAETALIDVSEYTKNVVKNIPVQTVAGIPLSGEPQFVEVSIPIEKIQAEPEAGSTV